VGRKEDGRSRMIAKRTQAFRGGKGRSDDGMEGRGKVGVFDLQMVGNY
jgi:hypothetical protein